MATMHTAANVSALQALNAAVGDGAYLQGYTTIGDAGSVADFYFEAPSSAKITGATNASPIVITTSANHNLTTGQRVMIAGVGGNQAANGTRLVTVLTNTTFQLVGTTGNGNYTPNT